MKEQASKKQTTKEEVEPKFYDKALAKIFSNVRFLRSLLRDIIKEPWVEEIDFTNVSVENPFSKGFRTA